MTETLSLAEQQRLKRWRMVLGGGESDGIHAELNEVEAAIDRAVSTLYDGGLSGTGGRKAGLGGSSPTIATWLGDIRNYFPTSVVQVMQRDAIDRFNLRQLLLEPELLSAAEPDIHLATTLMALRNLIPQKTKATARLVVKKVVDEITQRISGKMTQAVNGSLSRSTRNYRPRYNEIDWNQTIRANLKHYLAEYRTVIPERRIGYGRKRSSLKDIILCIDQSGSMASSVVYGAVFGAVLASLPAVSTRLIVFDTSVVDLTENLSDPVDLLFGVHLGGGTDINRALAACQILVHRPQETILVLISDLYEGNSSSSEMVKRAAVLKQSGVKFITLLALSDTGAPTYNHENAAKFASIGVPTFACTPDIFPDLIAAAIGKQDILEWASSQNIAAAIPAAEQVL